MLTSVGSSSNCNVPRDAQSEFAPAADERDAPLHSPDVRRSRVVRRRPAPDSSLADSFSLTSPSDVRFGNRSRQDGCGRSSRADNFDSESSLRSREAFANSL